MLKQIKNNTRKGQALVEYAMVLALISMVAILVVKSVGSKTTSSFNSIQSQMTAQGVATAKPMTPS